MLSEELQSRDIRSEARGTGPLPLVVTIVILRQEWLSEWFMSPCGWMLLGYCWDQGTWQDIEAGATGAIGSSRPSLAYRGGADRVPQLVGRP